MTNKEAVTMLNSIKMFFCREDGTPFSAGYDAIMKAVKLLERLPDEHGDLIDRDVALDYINRLICDGCNAETEADCEACIKKGIDDVLYFIKPTIEAERKDDGTTVD